MSVLVGRSKGIKAKKKKRPEGITNRNMIQMERKSQMSRRAQSGTYCWAPASVERRGFKESRGLPELFVFLGTWESLPSAKTRLFPLAEQCLEFSIENVSFCLIKNISLLKYKQSCKVNYINLDLSHIVWEE